MKKTAAAFFIFSLVLLTGCTTTFAGSVFVFNFRDLILYVGLAFAFASIIALKSADGKAKKNFWIWFILGLVLTPLASFIYLLILFTRNRK